MDQAKRDASNEALKSFFWANEAEKAHADFYDKSLQALRQGKDIEIGELHVCSVCGYTVEGTVPAKCPVCGESGDRFFTPA